MPASQNVRTVAHLDGSGFTYRERRCTQCSQWLVQDGEHFSPRVRGTTPGSEYNAWCRPCVRVRAATRPRPSVQSQAASTGRRFGVEIEFIGDGARLVEAMRAEGLRCSRQGYNHHVSQTAWKVVPDGSVCGGAELVSPVLRGASGEAAVEAAGRALAAADCTVDRSTGLHVHHEVSDLTVSAFQRLVRNWHDSQTAIDGLVAPSRRGHANSFCQPLDRHDLARVDRLRSMETGAARDALYGGDRYRALNVQSYPRYGTVEVRQHQGTVDARKIVAWVRFGQAMIEVAAEGVALAETDADRLIDALSPLAVETQVYLRARVAALTHPAPTPRDGEPSRHPWAPTGLRVYSGRTGRIVDGI